MNSEKNYLKTLLKILTLIILLINFSVLVFNLINQLTKFKEYDTILFYLIIADIISIIFIFKMEFKTIQLVGSLFQLFTALFMLFNLSYNSILYIISFVGFIMSVSSNEKGEKAMIEFKSLENTEIKDDVEQWFQDCYMCWIIIGSYKEDWNKIAGRDKNEHTINEYKNILARDWNIHNKAELLKQVHALTEESLEFFRSLTAEDIKNINREKVLLTNIQASIAWDLCRAVQIIGTGYISDFITRDEMRKYSIKVCKLIQQEFRSWDDLIRNYIIGCKEFFNERHGQHEDRTSNYEMLRDKKIAYQVDWNLNLE